MQQRFSKEAIDVAFKSLTGDMQALLLSADMNARIDTATGSAHLPLEQTKTAGYLTTCALLGLISPRALPEALTADAGIPPEIAHSICASLNQTVFPLFGMEYVSDNTEMPVRTHNAPQTPPRFTPPQGGPIASAFRTARADGVPVFIEAMMTINTSGGVSLGNADIESTLVRLWGTIPVSIKNTIVDQEYKHAVRNALLGHVLSPEEVAVLEEEVVMTLVGIQSKEEFSALLKDQVPGLTPTDASMVANHIDERFFALLSPFIDRPAEDSPAPSTLATPAPTMGMSTRSPLEQFVQTQADVRTRFEKLPEIVREAMLSTEIAHTFSETVRAYDLSQTQFIAYGKEAVRVMVGLATTKDFRTSITELTIVPKEHEESFARSVEQGVFKPVRDAIIHALEERRRNA